MSAWPGLTARGEATQEQIAALAELHARKAALETELDAVKKKIAEAEAVIDWESKPHKPGETMPVPTVAPTGKDAPRDWYAEFLKKNHVMVRQSVFSKTGKEEPALFQYTMPSQGDDSWLADVGVSLMRDLKELPGEPIAGLQADYHYNNAAGALKDSFQGGASMDFSLGDSTALAQRVLVEAGYRQDNLLAGEGVTGSLKWYPSSPGFGGEFLRVTPWLKGRISPYIGVEVETGNGVLPKIFKDGERFSGSAGVALNGLLFPDYLGNRLEAVVSVAYWNHFATSGGYEAYDENQFYFSSVLTYWLDRGKDEANNLLTPEEKHFGLSIKYVNGDNPGIGEFDADAWTFGLSIKF